MPPTYSLWSSTTIIFVGNLNMVRGTTITNADSFNHDVLESTVTEQLLSNTSLGKIIIGFETSSTDLWSAPTLPVSSDPSVNEAGSAQSTVSNSNTLVQVIMLTICAILQMETSFLDDEHSSPLHQSSTEASEPQLSPSPRQSKSSERATNGKHSLIKTNRFKSVFSKIKGQLKKTFSHFWVRNG